MSKSTKNYIFAGIALLIVLLGIFFFTQEPFRNDTDQYLKIKRDSWSAIQAAGSSNDKLKPVFFNLQTNLKAIKCSKVESVYQKECDSLKIKIDQAIDLLNNPSKNQGQEGVNLATDIAQILKN